MDCCTRVLHMRATGSIYAAYGHAHAYMYLYAARAELESRSSDVIYAGKFNRTAARAACTDFKEEIRSDIIQVA